MEKKTSKRIRLASWSQVREAFRSKELRQAGYSESGAAASQVRLASHKRRSSSADVAAQRQIMDALTQSQAEVEDAPTTLSGAQDELWTASAWVSLTLTLTLAASIKLYIVLEVSCETGLPPLLLRDFAQRGERSTGGTGQLCRDLEG